MIPNFIIFIPIGLFLIFKNRNFEKITIILSLGLMSIPALYAYTIPALDTRYLYVLFPMFSVLSVLTIEKFVGKIDRKNLIIIFIVSLIIISSLIFYDYKKVDYEHEKESFEIMKDISTIVNGVNNLSTESRYISTIETMNQWPNLYSEMQFDIQSIPLGNNNNLHSYISNSKDKGLTHILTDNNKERADFVNELFVEETKYPYLKKIYDSKDHGFEYQIKVFEINYEIFSSFKHDNGSEQN